MKKRIAYIGLSYPSLYDYRNQASKTKNDLWDSPNPIIDSPLGLMILYDELWFLCESLCPNNMRKLPYVKFVDVLCPDLWFEGAETFIQNMKYDNSHINRLSYKQILKRMNINFQGNLDTHTHSIKIGTVKTSSYGGFDNYAFDLYILSSLQNSIQEDIEMVSNPNYCVYEQRNLNAVSELTEKLIISDIPNYLSIDGPYHESIEELRENIYLKDFRRWIITNHENIQHSEIKDICSDVTSNIKDTQKRVFKKYLENNNDYSLFKSTGKIIISTAGGFINPGVSICTALSEIKLNIKKVLNMNSYRWQGFIIDAQDTISKLNK